MEHLYRELYSYSINLNIPHYDFYKQYSTVEHDFYKLTTLYKLKIVA